ncbi:MAG: hypothetical protein SWQ30_06770 [Thermodesulfobacteriota bacterium]|nr:hypothetical protein [Thermodesulfobacteriota bacterium]
MDLRLRFDTAATDHAERTCVVAVEIPGQSGTVLNGIVLDSVSEVLNLSGSIPRGLPRVRHSGAGRHPEPIDLTGFRLSPE